MSATVIAMLPRGRIKPRQRDPKRAVLKLFPKAGPGRKKHWVYAVGFEGGVTKIGLTNDPRKRFGQHWGKAEGRVEWVHLFAGAGGRGWAYGVEYRAKNALAKVGEQIHHSEWFRLVTKEQVVRCVREAVAAAQLAEERITANRERQSLIQQAILQIDERLKSA